MANNPDFTVKTPSINPTAIAELMQRKQEIENKQNQQALENYNDRSKRLVDAITTGQQVASNMLNLAEKRQLLNTQASQAAGQQAVQNIVASPTPQPPAPMASSTALPEQGTFGVQPSPEQTQSYADQIDKRKRDLTAALVQSGNGEVQNKLVESLFNKPQEAASPTFQSKTVSYNGKPKEVLFNPKTGDFHDPVTKETLTGDIQPYSNVSPTAEIRKQTLVDRQTENMGKDLNDLAINSSSPAGISAKRKLYASSGLNLIKQAEAQPGGVDKRQMAELQMEVARVLTGQGVMTNETLNALATNTAKSKVKNWEEWVTNNPTGTDQQAFVDRFKTTLQRQASFHGNELDKYKQKTMAKYTTFEKQAPNEFYASLQQAGYDPQQFKKSRKLVPSVENNPVEFDTIAANAGIAPAGAAGTSRPSLDSFFK